VQFLEALPIAEEDKNKVYCLNAARLGLFGERR